MADAFSVEAWLKADKANGAQQRVSISLPEQVFCWTRTGDQYLYADPTGLRPLVTDLGVLRLSNLNEGYPDAFKRKADPDDAVHVDVILYGVMYGGLPMDRVTVVTFRNNLNKLLLTPLQPNDPWVIDAVWHNRTLYLEIVKLPEQRQQPDQDRFTYYGYKFEALCTGQDPVGPVDSTAEFASMMQVRLGRHNVLMAAEMDAWDTPPEHLDLSAGDFAGFVELKTYVLPQGQRAEERLYREKYPRWWVQSFLAGVPTLVAGGRDRSGILQKVERLPVTRLPSLAHDKGYGFDAFQLLRFGDAALDWMAGVAAARPDIHLRFAHEPVQRAITVSELGPEEGGNLAARVIAALTPPPVQAGEGQLEGEGGFGGEEEF